MKKLGLLLLVALPVVPFVYSSLSAISAVNLYTAADGGGDDTQDCSRAHPCATVETACSKVPNDVARPYVIHVGGGTYSAGCHLVGKTQVSGTDWSSPGSITVECAQDLAATGTLTSVSA